MPHSRPVAAEGAVKRVVGFNVDGAAGEAAAAGARHELDDDGPIHGSPSPVIITPTLQPASSSPGSYHRPPPAPGGPLDAAFVEPAAARPIPPPPPPPPQVEYGGLTPARSQFVPPPGGGVDSPAGGHGGRNRNPSGRPRAGSSSAGAKSRGGSDSDDDDAVSFASSTDVASLMSKEDGHHGHPHGHPPHAPPHAHPTPPPQPKPPVPPMPPPPSAESTPATKPATTKADRRATQEAQRAAKATGASTTARPKPPTPPPPPATRRIDDGARAVAPPPRPTQKTPGGEVTKAAVVGGAPPPAALQFDDHKRLAKAARKSILPQPAAARPVPLFAHLPQFDRSALAASLQRLGLASPSLHPAITQLGLRLAAGAVVGGSARCLALLAALRQVVADYALPPGKLLSRDLLARVNAMVQFLIGCRPLGVAMGNAIKFLKLQVARVKPSAGEEEAKAALMDCIDRYVTERLVLAGAAVAAAAAAKIAPGDVVLTYARSGVVARALIQAHAAGVAFTVVVADSRPQLEGRALLGELLKAGLTCTYVHLNALSYVMRDVTKVLLGAAAVLANGAVVSRVGTAVVAMVAHAAHVPVLVCCESCKFHERVQLDSICANELGDPEALVSVPGREDVTHLRGWKSLDALRLLSLLYDATPAEYVTVLVTEHGAVPTSSAPVILREFRTSFA